MSLFRSLQFLLSALLFASFTNDASANNIILNPSFESGSDIEIDDWLQVTGPSVTTTRDSTFPNSGSFSVYSQFDHFVNPSVPKPSTLVLIFISFAQKRGKAPAF